MTRFAATLICCAAALRASSAPGVTFYKDVMPLLQSKCQSCHRPGEVAPMPFTSYEGTRPWAKAIKAAVLSKKMPPWSADPAYGHFLNERTLSRDEVNTLVSWVDSGAPAGDIKDQPPPIQWPDGWTIPPDVTVSLPHPISIPAKGVVELTELTIPSGFAKDTWVTSIEIRPANRSVVHHAVLSIVPHDKKAKYGVPHFTIQPRDADGVATKRIHKDDRLRGLVELDAVYVPGVPAIDFRLHHAAKLIPAGSDLVLQMHYTPNGTATTDQTQIGFTLAKEEPARQFVTVGPAALRDAENFHIPAGDPNWDTRSEIVFRQDAESVWFMPHMHLRGKDMTYRLLYPDGRLETLLSVKFDFNWQFGYDVAEPIRVPKGAKLQVTAHFDNSANNKYNPNPNRDVWWGDQTWEEMMVPWLGVIVDKTADPEKVVAYPPEFRAAKPRWF
jgi:hypothetical protein